MLNAICWFLTVRVLPDAVIFAPWFGPVMDRAVHHSIS